MSVFINLCGGLGNQMFQIANGIAYTKRFGKKIFLPREWGGMREERPSYWNNFLHKLNDYVVDSSEFNYTIHYREDFPKRPIPNFSEDAFLEGYFQSEKYFTDCKEEIQNIFYVPIETAFSTATVAVHIRRGDYLRECHYHKVLQKEYYDKAKQIIEEKLGYRPNYIYFSDDPDWVKEVFQNEINENDIVREGYKDHEDLIIMMNCHHFIIANSTFSWWGAWLSKHKEKIVICPNNWIEDFSNFQKTIYCQISDIEIEFYKRNPPAYSDPSNWEDIYCEGWIRI